MDVYGTNPAGKKLTEWYEMVVSRIPREKLETAVIEAALCEVDGIAVINVSYEGDLPEF